MDLIYADANRIDLGVLLNHKWDLAYGKDENNFVCEVLSDNHVCKEGYILYIEGTEYGGIIDKIQLGTSTETITYSGRTWHGILDGHVIEPDAGCDYYTANGEGNEVLADLIEVMGLSGLFKVSTADSGIDIVQHQIRYAKGYTAIRKMLFEFGGKLKMEYKLGFVELSVVPYVDYSQDEEWDSTQLDFEIERNYRPVNHVICLGKGDLRNRKVIHLFADANGGIRPYTLTDAPIQDADYILDKRNQVLFGEEENSQIYDCPNAGETEVYTALMKRPDDWTLNHGNYYRQIESGYEALEPTVTTGYSLQTEQPSNWNKHYDEYFVRSGVDIDGNYEYDNVSDADTVIYTKQTEKPSDWEWNFGEYFLHKNSEYVSVEEIVTETPVLLKQIPNDWTQNFANYYEYYSDGLTKDYRSVSGVTKYVYKAQTMKPSDWNTNYASYFTKQKNGTYVAVSGVVKGKKTVAPEWKAKKYFTKVSKSVAPAFKKNTYYRIEVVATVPVWESGKYYTKGTQTVPTWEENKYYTEVEQKWYTPFSAGWYYKKTIDSYAELVQGGLEILQKAYNCDTINIVFDDNQDYDIGDVVGANDTKTGLATWQPITKKIVVIQDNTETVDYEIGE